MIDFPSFQRQALSETLKNFTVEIQKVKKKEKKMKRLCRKTDNAFELQQIKQQLQEQDDLECTLAPLAALP